MPPDERRPKAARIKAGSFASVVRAFVASPKFAGLGQSTRYDYRHYLALAERPDTLGMVSVEELRPALIQAFLDGLADRPAAQRNAKTAIKSLERWAIVRDLLPHAITTGTEAPGGKGGHAPWPDILVDLAERECRPDIARIVTLAANTGQRASDLVKMRWSDIETYDGRAGINVTQQKTGLVIWIPLTQDLAAAMATWERRPTFIALRADGQPWTRPRLSTAWVRERDTRFALAPIRGAGLVLHGLRATAVVRLRRAGATIPQISDMVGMSPQMVTRYCRLSVQRENALAAVVHLDRTVREQPAVNPKKNST